MNNILVVSHERSGTHFLIESILANIENSIFPRIRPSFSTLENLLLPHDIDITKAWERFIYDDNHHTKIFKTHLTREELLMALDSEGYLTKADREILKRIIASSKVVYISRKTDDVMYSLYWLMKNGGGLQKSSNITLQTADFSQFIRMPNYHIMPIRRFEWFDYSLPRYHFYHMKSWSDNCDYHLTYEQLKENYSDVMHKLINFLGVSSNKIDINPPPNPFKKSFLSSIKSFYGRRPSYVQARKGIIGEGTSLLTESDKLFILQEGKIVENNF
jgi:hypothetical protein